MNGRSSNSEQSGDAFDGRGLNGVWSFTEVTNACTMGYAEKSTTSIEQKDGITENEETMEDRGKENGSNTAGAARGEKMYEEKDTRKEILQEMSNSTESEEGREILSKQIFGGIIILIYIKID